MHVRVLLPADCARAQGQARDGWDETVVINVSLIMLALKIVISTK